MEGLGKLGKSYQDIIAFEVVCEVFNSVSREKVPDFSRADTVVIDNLLKDTDWMNGMRGMSASDCWVFVVDKLKLVMKNHVPWKFRRRKSSRPSWMTKEVRCAIRQKRRMWRRYRTSNSIPDLAKFNIQQLKVQGLVSEAKLNFEKIIADNIKDNPKAFFSYVRSKQKVKDSVVSLRVPNAENVVTDSQDLADLLNDYFVSVFTKEDMSSLPKVRGESVFYNLDSVLFSSDAVLKELLRLNISKAPGPDAIYPFLLRTFAHHIWFLVNF